MMLGLEQGKVRLVTHQPGWRALFEAERTVLQAAMGKNAVAIEHVGSTAIIHICAKPILDILVGLQADIALGDAEPWLTAAGYTYRGEHGVPGRVLGVKHSDSLRTHHVHVTTWGGTFWHEHIYFRDYLNAHPTIAAEYEQLKRALAAQFPADRPQYTARKDPFIQRVLATRRISPQPPQT